MQVSFNWLKEYVDIDVTVTQLQELMTKAGVTIEHVDGTNKGVDKVVTAKVMAKEKHPDAEKLSVCQVTIDGESLIQVVCGAPNVAVGQVIPFAMAGATLPDGIKIKKTKLRGAESNGMICSAKELGINPDHIPAEQKDGILILPEDTPLGKDVVEVLGLNDYILELDLTPNRSDCLSVLNIAKEVGALLNKPVRVPEIVLGEMVEDIHQLAQVDILAPTLCHRYCAKMLKGVEIKPSPFWLQHRLQCAGMRPINNVVDVTNYIMMELGQPLHAFDHHEIAGHKITVRRAQDNETITTLDGNDRKLTEEMLLICDDARAVAVAGVMGGENTEVTNATTDVFVESAYFAPVSVRRTSTRLGLRTESSIRFEKGINMDTVQYAAARAVQLMQQLGGGVIVAGEIDEYPTVHEPVTVSLELAKVNAVLGTQISNEEIVDILTRLNFSITEQTATTLEVVVPSYRPDVTISEDLIEEVARLHGYDNIPETLPYGASGRGQLNAGQKIRDLLIGKLAALGLNEVVNYSFINKNNDEKMGYPHDDIRRNSVAVLNPLSEEQGHMRTSILPGLLLTALNNVNHRNEDLALFEIGKVFLLEGELKADTLANERWKLGMFLRGKNTSTWQHAGEAYDFYYLKGIVENIMAEMKMNDVQYVPCQDNSIYHPGRSAYVVLDGKTIGVFGELHPQIADNYGLKGRQYVAEIDVDDVIAHGMGQSMAAVLPKFPAVSRDLAVVVSEDVTSGDLLQCIRQFGGDLLVDAKIFDVYQGGQISANHKSIAFALTFQASDKTLTDGEVGEVYDRIYGALTEQFKAVLRS